MDTYIAWGVRMHKKYERRYHPLTLAHVVGEVPFMSCNLPFYICILLYINCTLFIILIILKYHKALLWLQSKRPVLISGHATYNSNLHFNNSCYLSSNSMNLILINRRPTVFFLFFSMKKTAIFLLYTR